MSEEFKVEIVDDPQNVVVEIKYPITPDIEVHVAETPTNLIVEVDNGIKGDPGPSGPPGEGVPVGGATGEVLRKASAGNYDTEWHTLTKGDVGLSNVDNTADLDKPISSATQTALDAKEDESNKSSDVNLGTSNTLYPTQGAVKTYVDTAVAGATIPDATTLVKGKVRLAGDLSGTADAPTVPALADKENTANKSTNTGLGTSDTLYPSQNAVKVYVDTAVAGATIPDATTLVKGKVRLSGDLSGTADSPTVPGLANKEDVANKSTDTALGSSDTLYPSQNAVKVYVDTAVAGATIPDATTLVKGKIKLAGDLSGTADLPTVPGLANKEPTITPGTTSQYWRGDKSWQTLDADAVGLGNVDNTSDLDKPISSATQTALDGKENSLGFSPENVANKSTDTSLGTSDTLYPTQNAVKVYVDSQVGGGTPDATTTVKGKIQLAGDLSGTADAPTVPELANKEDSANKSTDIALGSSDTLYPSQNAVKTYVDTAVAGATIPDATTTVKGKIQLAGDLSGTADAPTVPSLANKFDIPTGLVTDYLDGTGTPVPFPDVVDQSEFDEYNLLQKEPTGFPNRTDSVMSFDPGTMIFTIAPAVTSFDVYIRGKKYTKTTAQNIAIPNLDGNHYIYFDINGNIQTTQAIGPEIFQDNAFVSIIYWNSSIGEAIYHAEERHGLVMDGATHGYLHTVFGSRYLSGFALQGFSIDGDGNSDPDAQFTSDSGTFRDEDLVIQAPAQATIPILYRDGILWKKKPADSFPVIYSGTAGYTGPNGRLPYNLLSGGVWSLDEVPNNQFVLVHFFATNDVNNPVVGIQGVATYNSISGARTGATIEISSLAGLPFAEFVAIGSVIFETADGYANTPKAKVRSVGGGANYVDFRGTQTYSPSYGSASSHSLLSNLSSDDHLQYFNEERGDARYYTETEIDTFLSGTVSIPIISNDSIDANSGSIAPSQAAVITKLTEYATLNGSTFTGPVSIQNDGSYSNPNLELNDIGGSSSILSISRYGIVGDETPTDLYGAINISYNPTASSGGTVYFFNINSNGPSVNDLVFIESTLNISNVTGYICTSEIYYNLGSVLSGVWDYYIRYGYSNHSGTFNGYDLSANIGSMTGSNVSGVNFTLYCSDYQGGTVKIFNTNTNMQFTSNGTFYGVHMKPTITGSVDNLVGIFSDVSLCSGGPILALKTVGDSELNGKLVNNGDVEATGYVQGALRTQGAVPSTAGDPGVAGDIRVDLTHLYICVDTDTWKRVELETF